MTSPSWKTSVVYRNKFRKPAHAKNIQFSRFVSLAVFGSACFLLGTTFGISRVSGTSNDGATSPGQRPLEYATVSEHISTPSAEIRVATPTAEVKKSATPSAEIKTVVKPSPTPVPEHQKEKGKSWTGKVSYYSHAGCLGCHEKQITASGESFDENAMTLAIPAEWRKDLPMKTMVRVTNLDNGKSVVAKVNDTGGFLKYGRIADLSKGLYEAIGAKTDKTTIQIEVIE